MSNSRGGAVKANSISAKLALSLFNFTSNIYDLFIRQALCIYNKPTYAYIEQLFNRKLLELLLLNYSGMLSEYQMS
jgi:hypothetical protein